MSFKKFKKTPNKRKQNGEKITKGQASKVKLKSEVEVTSKEQISELDKEILSIQINESEGKLKRKMHLCSYMEEEMSIYKTLYSGKLFLKSESMKLLNEAFQDFASEIFLLDQEFQSMKSLYNNLAQRQHFCVEYQKRVDMLSDLGAELEKNLSESEKCSDEFSMFMKIFTMLEEKVSTEKENYNCIKQKILRDFDVSLLRVQKEINLKTEDVINDKDLKLDLLPLSWQVLFYSGWFSKSWLESSLKHLKFQQSKNAELERKYNYLLLFPAGDFDIIGNYERQVSLERENSATSEATTQYSELHHQCVFLETQVLHQRNKIESVKSEIADLEKAIQSLEMSGETYFEKSYLLQIVHKAGIILKHEFET